MSYIAKKGRAAAESATQEKQDFSKALVSFKSGTTYKVRLASDEDFVEYNAVSVFKSINTTPVSPGNMYAKAVDLLYKDAEAAKKAGDEAKAEELRNQAYLLKPKPRYLFGFINLADGQPIVIDVSKKQAQALITSIDKYAKKLDKLAFELSKSGQSTSTTVTLSPIIDEDDLTDVERKNFEASAGKAFPDETYENVLYEKDAAEQIEDLRVFGFDVSRLGASVDEGVTPITEDGEQDYGF
jgi:hypothetical protein